MKYRKCIVVTEKGTVTYEQEVSENNKVKDLKDVINGIMNVIKENKSKFFEKNIYVTTNNIIPHNKIANRTFWKNNKGETKEIIEDIILQDAYDFDFDDEYDIVKEQAESFVYLYLDDFDLFDELTEEERKEIDEYLLDKVEDNVKVNFIYEISEEITYSMAPYQDGDDEGSQLGAYLQRLKVKLEIPTNPIWKNIEDSPTPEIIEKLFASQGYKIEDLQDRKKVESSKFLKSFIEELEGCDYLAFLSFVIKIKDMNEFNKFIETDEVTVLDEPCVICNYVHGSGSYMGIELEKPFTFEKSDSLIVVEDERSNYGYNLMQIYGGI